MTKPLVSILLVSYNSDHIFKDCLELFLDISRDLACEIVICDNHSDTKPSLSVLNANADISKIKLHHADKNRGFAWGMNKAASLAKGKYLLITNFDSVFSGEDLKNCLKYLETQPAVSGVSPLVESDSGGIDSATCRRAPDLHSMMIEDTLLSRLLPSSISHQRLYCPDFNLNRIFFPALASGCFLMIRKELFFEIGPFDENFFLYFEDADLSYRLYLQGKGIHCLPHIRIHHQGQQSSRSTPEKRRLFWHRSYYLFISKHLSPLHCRILALLRLIDLFFQLFFKMPRAVFQGRCLFLLKQHIQLMKLALKVLKGTALA
jgi:GT2 family glycosyltransferase